ncbi:hypothetical protein ES703_103870 [subsurface metagenome]
MNQPRDVVNTSADTIRPIVVAVVGVRVDSGTSGMTPPVVLGVNINAAIVDDAGSVVHDVVIVNRQRCDAGSVDTLDVVAQVVVGDCRDH